MLEKWYSSKRIRQILQISSQCLYEMKKHGRIEYKQISPKKFLFKLPKTFEAKEETSHIAIYARVSTPKQKKDLQHQIQVLKQFVVANGHIVDDNLVFSDIASGMNENRKALQEMIFQIIDGNINKVIISNRDRLTRFGFGYFKHLFERFNCEIIEVNLTEDKTFEQEMTDDLIAIIHHFSMKFYGKRKTQLKKLENDMKSESEASK